MAGATGSVFLDNFLGGDHLRIRDGGKIPYPLLCPNREVGLPAFDAGEKLAAMNLVDEIIEVETLAAFRIGKLRGVTEGTVTRFSRCASMRPEGVVAVIARGGFHQVPPELNLTPCGDKVVQRIRGIFSVAARHLATHHVGRLAVKISRERCLEGVSKSPRAHANQSTSLVKVWLEGLRKSGFSRLVFVDVVFADDFTKD